MKKFKVRCNWGEIVEAENEEEAERKFWDMFDNSFLKADIKEVKEEKELNG